MRKAFTLIELLIVIAIIGILAVTVLLALNPAEAQKKSRDVQRVKDTSTLQAAFEQLIESGAVIPSDVNEVGNATGAVSSGGIGGANLGVKAQGCSDTAVHWLGAVNLCAYIKNVPLDPNNGTTRAFATPLNETDTTTVNQRLATYRAKISGSDYEINVRQESASNVSKIFSDGGDAAATEWFEVFSGPNTTITGN